MEPTNGQHDRTERSPAYRLIDEHINAPPLPGAVIARPTADELIDVLAADLVVHAEQCVRDTDEFHLALSGGSTPVPLYERLMYDPDCRRLPWRRTHLWIVDERCVPLDDPASNFHMIRETIVEHSDIPPEQVHPVHAADDDADRRYEDEIKQTMLWRETGQDRLDYVLLGVGGDGHTASLFPGNDVLHESHRLVRRVHHAPAEPPNRITMTFPLINAARFVAVLVTGAAKAPIIERIADDRGSVDDLPIRGITPVNGELRWYLDAGACGQVVD